MHTHIESMESRLFLSATPVAVTVLKAAETAFKADVTALHAGSSKRVAALEADLKRVGTLKGDKLLLKALIKQGGAAFNLLHKDANTEVSLLNRDLARLLTDEKKLVKKPTNVLLIAKTAADVAALQTEATNAVSLVNSLSTSLHSTDADNLNALAAANAGNALIQNDISNGINTQETKIQTLQASVSTLFIADVAAVIALFAGS